jgi:aminoglycoside phosphotransferase (APT) family kinase protein
VTNGQGTAPAGPMWTAEIVVTAEFAADLIGEQFPDLAGGPVTVLETGWDNTAFVVGGQWLFRFPRRQVAVPGVQREIAVLPRLAPRLPLPIPDPQYVGQPSARYPWPFFGARLLAGGELAESGLADADRRGAAASIGSFLRALHDPGLVPLADGAGLPVDPMRRASPPVRAGRAREVLDRLVRRGLWPADSEVGRFLDQAEREPEGARPDGSGASQAEPDAGTAPASGASGSGASGSGASGGGASGGGASGGGASGGGASGSGASGSGASGSGAPGTGPLVVSHGDLHVRHVLVDSAGGATGVIDWGDLCLADPAVDLSIAYLGFAGQARADLLSSYGRPVTARRELAARTCALSVGVALAEYAADEDRAVLLQESLAGLRRAVAD